MRQIDYDGAINKLISFLREKVDEARASGVVVGVSGGVDSAVTAFLAVKALGKERVIGLIMPYYENQDVEDAKLVCETLGIDYKIINIRPIVDAFEKSLDFIKLQRAT